MNKKLMIHGKAKTRGSYKIFELDSKAVREFNKKKVGSATVLVHFHKFQ
jgi:hypothetical protein